MEDREARQSRLRDRLEARAYGDAVARAAEQLSRLLGTRLSAQDALPQAAVESARSAYLQQERYHLIWRRVWGVRLRDEMLEICRRLASDLPDRVTLVWVDWDEKRKPVQGAAVAFEVAAQIVLLELPQHLGPPPDNVGPGGAGSDILLTCADGQSGVHLDYQHHADRDEYEMLVWGAFARPLLP